MSDAPIKMKDKLLRLLSHVESKAEHLEALGRDIVQSARLSRDVAGPIRDIALQVPSDGVLPRDWARQLENWQSWHDVAGELEKSGTAVKSFAAVSMAATSYSCATFTTVPLTSFASLQIEADIEGARARLRYTLERFPLVDDALAEMRRLRLDAHGGNYRTPVELLDEARGALDRPAVQDGGPVSVLIPLRECIHSTISELLRRRPTQEPVVKVADKLASLGRQCSRPGLEEAHFERLGADADGLLNGLSSAKQVDMPRQQLSISRRGFPRAASNG